MATFRQALASDECAVVLRAGGDPQVIRGPGSVRRFHRWRQVKVVGLSPYPIDVLDVHVVTSDGEEVVVSASAEGQVVDPVAAATRVVDYRKATRLILETAIRALATKRPVADIRERTSELESAVGQAVAEAVEDWGIAVSSITLRPA
jgi:hypothetical protein